MLEEYHRLVVELGRRPTWAELDKLSATSSSTFRRVLGKQADIDRAYAAWQGQSGRVAANDRTGK